MATRTLKFSQWLKLVAKHTIAGEFDDAADHLIGMPPDDAAKKLSVTRERVSQLIREEKLDTLQVTNAAGRVCITLVTEASLDRYLAQRTPDRNRQGYFAFEA